MSVNGNKEKRKRKLTRDDLFSARYGRKTGKLDIFDGREINDSDDVFADAHGGDGDADDRRDVRSAIAKWKLQHGVNGGGSGSSQSSAVGSSSQHDGRRHRAPLCDVGQIPDSPIIDDDDDDNAKNTAAFRAGGAAGRGKRKTLYQQIIDGEEDEMVLAPSPGKRITPSGGVDLAPSDAVHVVPSDHRGPDGGDGIDACRRTLDFNDDDDDEEGDDNGESEKENNAAPLNRPAPSNQPSGDEGVVKGSSVNDQPGKISQSGAAKETATTKEAIVDAVQVRN